MDTMWCSFSKLFGHNISEIFFDKHFNCLSNVEIEEQENSFDNFLGVVNHLFEVVRIKQCNVSNNFIILKRFFEALDYLLINR